MDSRIALRKNIELTRQNFHRILNSIPEAALTQPSKDPALTNGELLMQMCLAPRLMMSGMKNMVDRSWIYPPLLNALPKPLNKKLNELYIRYWAHRSTCLSLGTEFDKTCLFALKLLEEMGEEGFETPLIPAKDDGPGSEITTRRKAFEFLICYCDTYSKLLDIHRNRRRTPALPRPSNHRTPGGSAGQ